MLFIGLGMMAPGEASAKEKHLEHVRTLLLSRAAKCTSCHVQPDGKALNLYGKRIAEEEKNAPFADRIAAVEAEPPLNASRDRAARHRAGQDVDKDGVPNWVEVLAGTSPADPEDKPTAAAMKRVQEIVSCKLCHTATGLPGEGLAANPHNSLGNILAETHPQKPGVTRGRSAQSTREAAERTPILVRLGMIGGRKPKGSKATYWEKLLLLHAPSEDSDTTASDVLSELRKRLKLKKNKRTAPTDEGIAAPAHPIDGFLLDAAKLP